MTTERVGDVDVMFRPAKSPAEIGYAPLNPSTTVLPKGSVQRDGAMPLAEIFKTLKAMNYQGCVNLEYEIDADNPLPGMAKSFGYMRGVLAGLRA